MTKNKLAVSKSQMLSRLWGTPTMLQNIQKPGGLRASRDLWNAVKAQHWLKCNSWLNFLSEYWGWGETPGLHYSSRLPWLVYSQLNPSWSYL